MNSKFYGIPGPLSDSQCGERFAAFLLDIGGLTNKYPSDKAARTTGRCPLESKKRRPLVTELERSGLFIGLLRN